MRDDGNWGVQMEKYKMIKMGVWVCGWVGGWLLLLQLVVQEMED
jgi:hypothetical protein